MMVRLSPGTITAVLRRPAAFPATLRSVWAMAPTGWWRRRPFLPLPDSAYWRFRLETSNGGDGTTPPSSHEVSEVLDWAARMRHHARSTP
jgi:hypothetical protein